jgi:type I restriction enzyme S subunit
MSEAPTPRGWIRADLGDLGRFSTSSVDKKDTPGEVPVPLVNYMDVYRHNFIDSRLELMRVTASRTETQRFALAPGDLLFTPSSETPADIGHGAVVVEELAGALHSYHTVRLRPSSSEQLDRRFSGWFVNSPTLGRYFATRATGSTRYTLSLGDFRAAPAVFPTALNEQRAIAQVLDAAHDAIRSTERLIAKLVDVRQGLFRDLLARGIDEKGHLREPGSEPEIVGAGERVAVPAGWRICELDSVVDPRRPVAYGILMPGYGFPGGVPVIKVKDIKDGRISEGELLLTDPRIDKEYRRSRVKEGDLLFSIRGTVGRTALVPPSLEGANITQDTARIAITGANAKFVAHYLRMPLALKFIELHTLGQAVRGINLRDVRRIPLVLPCRSEQDALVDTIEAYETRVEAEQARCDKLRSVMRGLIGDLLTGRVRALVQDETRG